MKNIYRGIALFDIDGVIANFEGKFCEDFGNAHRGLYSLESRYPNYADLIREWVNEPKTYEDLEPIFGGILFMNIIRGKGYDIKLVTARSKSVSKVTEDWLSRYNIHHTGLFFAKDKTELFSEFDTVSILVDDSISNLRSAKKKYPECSCVAWSQPWNEKWVPRAYYNDKTYKVEVKTK